MTDTMGRMHSDAQFAGSSSVPAHVETMGFLGIGNNLMVGCTVACAVDIAQALVSNLLLLYIRRVLNTALSYFYLKNKNFWNSVSILYLLKDIGINTKELLYNNANLSTELCWI